LLPPSRRDELQPLNSLCRLDGLCASACTIVLSTVPRDKRDGLTPQMIFLRGKVLQAMFRPCH
jgi:hypothetical protein